MTSLRRYPRDLANYINLSDLLHFNARVFPFTGIFFGEGRCYGDGLFNSMYSAIAHAYMNNLHASPRGGSAQGTRQSIECGILASVLITLNGRAEHE